MKKTKYQVFLNIFFFFFEHQKTVYGHKKELLKGMRKEVKKNHHKIAHFLSVSFNKVRLFTFISLILSSFTSINLSHKT